MEAETYCPALCAEYATIAAIIEGDNVDDIYDLDPQDNSPSPEDILIAKDTFRTLSDEARELARLILACHQEFFAPNGKLKKKAFQNYCRKIKGWNAEKTEDLKFELGLFLTFAFN